jgi:hypothetical protein
MRLSPSLDPLGTTRLDDTINLHVEHPQLAPLPTGWVVVGSGYYGDIAFSPEKELFFHTLDANGTPIGRTALWTFTVYPPSYTVVPRPDGGPLIFWTENNGDSGASVVAPDGLSVSRALTFPGSVAIGAATFAGGAFYVLVRPGSETIPGEVARGYQMLVRIAADGSSMSWFDAPFNYYAAEDQVLFALGDELWLAYGPARECMDDTGKAHSVDPPYRVHMQRLGPDGALLGEPAVMQVADGTVLHGPIPFGSDLVSLVGRYLVGLKIQRVTSDGRLVASSPTISSRPSNWLAVRRGPDAVVLTRSQHGEIELLRVTP